MIIRKYEVYIKDAEGEILIGRYFRRNRAWHEAFVLTYDYQIPYVNFRDRTAPPRRTKAFLHGH